MNTPTVDRFRYPWRRLVPGEVHTITVHWADDRDVHLSTFTAVMVDAYTAIAVTGVTYAINATQANVGKIVATATIPADIDTDAQYEIRVKQDGETIVAGGVLFNSSVVPVTP
jgi:hypothetical protein